VIVTLPVGTTGPLAPPELDPADELGALDSPLPLAESGALEPALLDPASTDPALLDMPESAAVEVFRTGDGDFAPPLDPAASGC
jgi:hypothetical protein